MAKIAILSLGGHGHVNPTLAVVEELGRRKHDVTLWVTEEFKKNVEAIAVKFKPVDSLMAKAERPQNVDPQMMVALFSKLIMEETLHVLPQLEKEWIEDRPDLLLFDNMCLSGRILAEAYGIPAIALFTTYPGNAQFDLFHHLGTLAGEAQADYEVIMDGIVSKYGVRWFPFHDLFTHAEPLNLVFMPHSWQPHADLFDERFQFIGPCLGTRLSGSEFPVELLQRHPLLYISLGTAWSDRPEFYRTCFQAFEKSEWNVIMSIGNKTDVRVLGRIPENFTVRAHLPQLEVLRSAHVFLTHGGMNSTMEGLSFGVPLVAIPQMFEQAVTARRIADKGVGISLEGAVLHPDLLRSSVDRAAYDPEIRKQVSILQSAIQATGGAKLAADLIQEYGAKLNLSLRPQSERSGSASETT